MSIIKREDLVYPELSYQIVGVLFTVFNNLGYQYQEKYYQRAIKEELRNLGLKFREQVADDIRYRDKIIGRYIYDFLIEDKVLLEIKRGDDFSRNDIVQTVAYLKKSGLSLCILARFSSSGLKFKRIVDVQ